MPGEVVLVVFAGRPGTGKTTVARQVAERLHAAYLRIDAIETAVTRCGLAQAPIGPVGYVIAQDLAAANLAIGTSVVIDAVNPVPEARAGWQRLGATAALVVFETLLPDLVEHRRRVVTRQPDLEGQSLPSWTDVTSGVYVVWDEQRDGRRYRLDTTDTSRAVSEAWRVVTAALFGESTTEQRRSP